MAFQYIKIPRILFYAQQHYLHCLLTLKTIQAKLFCTKQYMSALPMVSMGWTMTQTQVGKTLFFATCMDQSNMYQNVGIDSGVGVRT